MKLSNLMAIIVTLYGAAAYGQAAPPPPPTDTTASKPKTKLEAFSARIGTAVIVGYTTIGTMKGQYGEEVEVDAREIRDAGTGRVVSGLTIGIKESRYTSNTCFVDLDEIESLVKGIEYIGKATNSITKLANFEARYKTNGDLDITVFSKGPASSAKPGVSLKCGSIGRARAVLRFEDLEELKGLIRGVSALLERNKAGS